MEVEPFKHVPKRPFVQVAGIFDRLIVEQSGIASGLSPLENVTVEIQGNLNNAGAPGAMALMHEAKFLIALGGLEESSNRIVINQYTPFGGPFPVKDISMDATGPLGRIQLRLELSMVLTGDQEGWHWFYVVVNGEELARIPLEVRYDDLTRSLIAPTLADAILPATHEDSESGR